MDMQTKKEGDVLLVKPMINSINVNTSASFKTKFNDLIAQGNLIILLNLSEIDFIDSSGLGAIISVLKSLSRNKGHLAICGAKTPVVNLFSLTRLDRVLKLCSNEKEGMQSLQNRLSASSPGA